MTTQFTVLLDWDLEQVTTKWNQLKVLEEVAQKGATVCHLVMDPSPWYHAQKPPQVGGAPQKLIFFYWSFHHQKLAAERFMYA